MKKKRRYVVQQHFILGYCVWDCKNKEVVKDKFLGTRRGFRTKSAAKMYADRLEAEMEETAKRR